jgi:putative membrane protein (TIGR04086 family)
MQGGLVGIGYCVILVLLNVIFIKPIQFDLLSGSRLVLATITGIIGGMIGINLS